MPRSLTIISLDQGKLWDAEADPTEEVAARREAVRQMQNGGTRPPFWTSVLRRPRPGRPEGA